MPCATGSPAHCTAGGRSAPGTPGSSSGSRILTPVFTADLQDAQVPAQEAITALVLDAPLRAETKIALAQELGSRLLEERGRVPDLHPAFAALRLSPAERIEADRLEAGLNEQLERAATRAFRDSFLIAALLALAGLVPLLARRTGPAMNARDARAARARRRAGRRRARGPGRARAAAISRPPRSADPCVARAVTPVSEGHRRALRSGSCCSAWTARRADSSVTREGLVLRLAEPDARTTAEVDAVRGGLRDAVDRLDRDGSLPKASALADEAVAAADLPGLVKSAIGVLPDALIDNRLKTADILRRTLDGLDVRRLLDNLDDPAEIETLVSAEVTDAVKDEIVDGLPHPFG